MKTEMEVWHKMAGVKNVRYKKSTPSIGKMKPKEIYLVCISFLSEKFILNF